MDQLEMVADTVTRVEKKLDEHIVVFGHHVDDDNETKAQVQQWSGALSVLLPIAKWLLGLVGAGLTALAAHVWHHWY